MTAFNLEPQYLFKLTSLPRGFSTSQSIGNRCNVPMYTVTVDLLGNCLLCDCDGWLPLPVGKVQDFDSINEVLESDPARLLQKDVSEGNFSWCAVDHCGIRDRDIIKTKTTLAINIDESCNLHCPSCRRDPIMITQGPEYQKKLQNVDKILQWLARYEEPIHIILSGNGDPLASHILRGLLIDWQPRTTQTFTLKTNGLLIKKLLFKLPVLDQITLFSVSIDAGSQAVYEDVRRPGKWSMLLENLDFLKKINKNSATSLNFGLQNKNYQDIPSFIALCESYGMRGFIHQIDDWGTWNVMVPKIPDAWTINNGVFSEHNILSAEHPNHLTAKQIISDNMQNQIIKISPFILSNMGLQ